MLCLIEDYRPLLSKQLGRLIVYLLLTTIAFATSCSKTENKTESPTTNTTDFFIRGVDISFSPEIESYITFITGTPSSLDFYKSKGINTVRLRVWNSPADINSSPQQVLAYAKFIKAKGLKVWIDFHYSDTWADPANQIPPVAWQNLTPTQMGDSVYAFTHYVLSLLNQNNVSADFVQIGNEINGGFLWPMGKVYNPTENWTGFIPLLQQGIAATRTACPTAKIMLHTAGYNNYFFESMRQYNIDYDIIGVSYYPWWHGKNLNDLENGIHQLSTQFNKPVVIAETAYPFTFGWDDNTNNIVGDTSKTIEGFDASPTGQAKFIDTLVKITQKSSLKNNSGICYWAPDWVAYKGKTATNGSTWENLALYDFDLKPLPAWGALGGK